MIKKMIENFFDSLARTMIHTQEKLTPQQDGEDYWEAYFSGMDMISKPHDPDETHIYYLKNYR